MTHFTKLFVQIDCYSLYRPAPPHSRASIQGSYACLIDLDGDLDPLTHILCTVMMQDPAYYRVYISRSVRNGVGAKGRPWIENRFGFEGVNPEDKGFNTSVILDANKFISGILDGHKPLAATEPKPAFQLPWDRIPVGDGDTNGPAYKASTESDLESILSYPPMRKPTMVPPHDWALVPKSEEVKFFNDGFLKVTMVHCRNPNELIAAYQKYSAHTRLGKSL